VIGSSHADPAAQLALPEGALDRQVGGSHPVLRPARAEAGAAPTARTHRAGRRAQGAGVEALGDGQHRPRFAAAAGAARAPPRRADRLRHARRERRDPAPPTGDRQEPHHRSLARNPALSGADLRGPLAHPAGALRPAPGPRVLHPLLGDLLVPGAPPLLLRLQLQGEHARPPARRRDPVQHLPPRRPELPLPAGREVGRAASGARHRRGLRAAADHGGRRGRHWTTASPRTRAFERDVPS
jgi:hypothetical protein